MFPMICFCPLCGEFQTSRRLCDGCRRKLTATAREYCVQRREFKFRYLLDWQEENQMLRHLIHSLKGDQCQQEWRYWAEIFLSAHNIHCVSNLVLIPAPTVDGTLDHAGIFSKNLSKIMGAPCWPILRKKPSSHTKTLKKTDRFKRQLTLSSPINPPLGSRIVFVDDVLTSGATAQAAFQALKEPIGFEVWTLAYRQITSSIDKRHHLSYNASNL